MKTVVVAPDELWEELSTTLNHLEFVRVNSVGDFSNFGSEDVFFNLCQGAEKVPYNNTDGLLFINSQIITLKESNQPSNVFRLNCWNGFLKRNVWEIAGVVNDTLSDYLLSINKEFIATPDLPGFVSSRIISMIINEAYFSLAEGVSTKHQIDVAMKLGTNYPRGPFEWSEEIGLKNVLSLLQTLSNEDVSYQPAPLLLKESEA